MTIPLKAYKEDLYYSFYDTHGENPKYYEGNKKFLQSRLGGDRRIEKRRLGIREALVLYNGFFTKFYQEHNGEIVEEIFLEKFVEFMGKISTKKINLSIVHNKKDEMPHGRGSITGAIKENREVLKIGDKDPHNYEIEIMDLVHKSDFEKIVTLSHELVHLVESEFEDFKEKSHLFI